MTNPAAKTLEWNLISQPCVHSTHYGWNLFCWTFLAYFDWFQLVQVGDKHAKQIHVLLSRKLATSPWFLVQSRGEIYKYDKSNCIQAGFIKIAGNYVKKFYDYLRSLSCMALIIPIFICVVTIFQQNTLQIWYYSNQGKTERK